MISDFFDRAESTFRIESKTIENSISPRGKCILCFELIRLPFLRERTVLDRFIIAGEKRSMLFLRNDILKYFTSVKGLEDRTRELCVSTVNR